MAEPQAPVRTAAPSPAPSPAPSASTTISSPLEALEKDEILRTRRFCLVGACIGIAGGASATTLPVDPLVTKVFLSGVVAALLGLLLLFLRTRSLVEFRRPSTNAAWVLPGACATLAIPFFGSFSPAPILLVLGIYFTSLGRSFRLSLTLYAVCAGMQGLTGGLVIAGYRDTGLVHPVGLSSRDESWSRPWSR